MVEVDVFLTTDDRLLRALSKMCVKQKDGSSSILTHGGNEFMNDNTVMPFRSPALIRKAGMDALVKELGVVDAIYFIRQFSTGHR
jgi:hypothetical protein